MTPLAPGCHPRKNVDMLISSRSSFSATMDIRLGSRIQIEFAGGKQKMVLVTEINESEVTLDGNHPLTSKDLTFALQYNGVLM